jgi:hypothetical protein
MRVYRNQILFFMALMGIILVGSVGSLGSSPPSALAWSPVPGILPGSNNEAFWPDVAVDSTGMAHAVWHDIDGGTGSAVWYVRGQINATATAVDWQAAVPLSTQSGLRAIDNTARIATDKKGTIHLIFEGTDYRLYYFYSVTQGASWAAESINLYEKSWNPDIAVDDNGTAYVTWANGVGNGNAEAWYTYRTGPNTWMAPAALASGAYLIRRNHIAANIVSGQPVVHVMYDFVPREGQKDRAFYSRGVPASFSPAVDFSLTYLGFTQADNAVITADKTIPGRLYAGFVHGATDTGFQFYFSTSADNGITWPGFAPLSIGASVWSEQVSLFGYQGIAHIASEEKYWDGKAIANILIWYRTFNSATGAYPRLEQISGQEKSTKPSIDGGGSGKFVAWIRGFTDNVKFSFDPLEGGVAAPTATPTSPPATATPVGTPTPTATPTPLPDLPVGEIKIENGEALIKAANASVTFKLKTGTADQYKIWNEGSTEPTFKSIPVSTPLKGPDTYIEKSWTVYSSSSAESFPCKNVTVYGQFNNTISGNSSSKMSASTIVDPGVDADVNVKNPAVGSASYTSQMAYMLDVQARSTECSNLQAVKVGEKTVSQTLSSDLKPVLAVGLIPLMPGTSASHTIVVEVTDGVGHVQTYERVITVDTQVPQLSADIALLTAPATAESILTDLVFNNIGVTDDLYGKQTGESKPFWGVLLANSREKIALDDSAKLDALSWQSVEVKETTSTSAVSGTIYNFTVPNWNLFAGLSSANQASGSYYVYARVIDGAGNASTTTLQSNTIALSATYVTPTPTPGRTPTVVPSSKMSVFLPLVVR